jgi:hypothetical protein
MFSASVAGTFVKAGEIANNGFPIAGKRGYF